MTPKVKRSSIHLIILLDFASTQIKGKRSYNIFTRFTVMKRETGPS